MINRISAKIIADSITKQGDRLTTYILVFPRIILAEFNTHRMISKNSASSRAIPFQTMLKRVTEEPFIPIAFQKDHKGMQGSDYFEGDDLQRTHLYWEIAAEKAVNAAEELSRLGVTKQLCNRLLEPFLYHTVICTGSEWGNFFALRAHKDAEIHIADLAEKMLVAYNESIPKVLRPGEWHIPFGDTFDNDRLSEVENPGIPLPVNLVNFNLLKVKIATARCARVSYLNFEGKDDYHADLRLYDQLIGSGHMSPAEHCARAMNDGEYRKFSHSKPGDRVFHPSGVHLDGVGTDFEYGWCGNFRGFIQLRKTLQGENKQDIRVMKK